MSVTASAKREFVARPGVVFELATGLGDAPYVFTGWGPISRIDRIEILGGGAMTVGTTRRVFFHNRTRLDEDVVAFQPPVEWVGVVRQVPPRFAWLVRGSRSRWTFEESDGRTIATWRCVLEPASPRLRPLVAAAAYLLFSPMMRRALRNMERLVLERGQWTER